MFYLFICLFVCLFVCLFTHSLLSGYSISEIFSSSRMIAKAQETKHEKIKQLIVTKRLEKKKTNYSSYLENKGSCKCFLEDLKDRLIEAVFRKTLPDLSQMVR